jgi:hypothetical protein
MAKRFRRSRGRRRRSLRRSGAFARRSRPRGKLLRSFRNGRRWETSFTALGQLQDANQNIRSSTYFAATSGLFGSDAPLTDPRVAFGFQNFELYRVTKVTFTLTPCWSSSSNFTTGGAGVPIPQFAWRRWSVLSDNNPENLTSPANTRFSDFINMAGVRRIRRWNKPISFSFSPKVLTFPSTPGGGTVAGLVAPGRSGQWLSTYGHTGLADSFGYFGMSFFAWDGRPPGTALQMDSIFEANAVPIATEVKYHFQFKGFNRIHNLHDPVAEGDPEAEELLGLRPGEAALITEAHGTEARPCRDCSGPAPCPYAISDPVEGEVLEDGSLDPSGDSADELDPPLDGSPRSGV